MGYLSAVGRLFHHLVLAVKIMRLCCRYLHRMNGYVQSSNASDTLKASSTSLIAAADLFCDQLQAHKADLADGIVGND